MRYTAHLLPNSHRFGLTTRQGTALWFSSAFRSLRVAQKRADMDVLAEGHQCDKACSRWERRRWPGDGAWLLGE